MYLMFAIVGAGIGPQLVGVLSDHFAPHYGHESVRYALLVVVAVNVWAAVHFYIGSHTIRQDVQTASEMN